MFLCSGGFNILRKYAYLHPKIRQVLLELKMLMSKNSFNHEWLPAYLGYWFLRNNSNTLLTLMSRPCVSKMILDWTRNDIFLCQKILAYQKNIFDQSKIILDLQKDQALFFFEQIILSKARAPWIFDTYPILQRILKIPQTDSQHILNLIFLQWNFAQHKSYDQVSWLSSYTVFEGHLFSSIPEIVW